MHMAGDFRRFADHLTLVDNHPVFGRHMRNRMALEFLQIHEKKLHMPLIAGQAARKILYFGEIAVDGGVVAMHEYHAHAALHHRIGGDRRINAAGKKRHALARRADRQAADAGDFAREDIGRVARDFEAHVYLGPFEVDAQLQFVFQKAADFKGDFRRFQRKSFVAALHRDAKRLAGNLFAVVGENRLLCGLLHGFEREFGLMRNREIADAGQQFQVFDERIIQRCHIGDHASVLAVQAFGFEDGFQRATDILRHAFLEQMAIPALKRQLAEMKKDFSHARQPSGFASPLQALIMRRRSLFVGAPDFITAGKLLLKPCQQAVHVVDLFLLVGQRLIQRFEHALLIGDFCFDFLHARIVHRVSP